MNTNQKLYFVTSKNQFIINKISNEILSHILQLQNIRISHGIEGEIGFLTRFSSQVWNC